MKFYLLSSFAILMALKSLTVMATEAKSSSINQNQEKNTTSAFERGISSRLLPKTSQTITVPEAYFAFGIYKEYLLWQTSELYEPSGLGLMLGFQQHIRGPWSGGIEVLWSDWKAKPTHPEVSDTSPLSIFSKIDFEPTWPTFVPRRISSVYKPYLSGGIGYTLFFDSRSLMSGRTKSGFGQTAATYGGGLRIILPVSFSLKIGLEQWNGIENSTYSSNAFYIQLNIGDVDKF